MKIKYAQSLFLFICLIWIVVWILPQYYKVFENLGIGQILFSIKFCSLSMSHYNWCVVRLEPCDSSWLSSLPYYIDCLTHSHGCFYWFKFLIQSNQHTWIHRKCQVVEEVMMFTTNKGVHVCACIDRCD